MEINSNWFSRLFHNTNFIDLCFLFFKVLLKTCKFNVSFKLIFFKNTKKAFQRFAFATRTHFHLEKHTFFGQTFDLV